MITINLLPVKQIQRRLYARKQLFLFVGFVVSLVLVLAAVNMVVQQKVDRLRETNAALEKERDSYGSTLAEIEKLKADKAALETKLGVIATLKRSSQLTVRIMDELSNLTPANKLWLTSFTQSEGQMQFAGIALDNSIIANYMEQLEASPFFADPELQGSSLYETGGQKLKSFSLTCAITQPEKVEKEGDSDANG